MDKPTISLIRSQCYVDGQWVGEGKIAVYGTDPAKIRDWAQAAQDLGYAYIEVPDHVVGATARDGFTAIVEYTAPEGSALNCDGTGNDVLVHIPGLLFANSDCADPGCPIGGVPVQKGGFSPTLHTYFNVDTDGDGRYDDAAYNVVWTDGRYQVLRRSTDGSPCTWRVRGTTADFYRSAVILYAAGAMALDVTVNRDDGLCGS